MSEWLRPFHPHADTRLQNELVQVIADAVSWLELGQVVAQALKIQLDCAQWRDAAYVLKNIEGKEGGYSRKDGTGLGSID